MSIFFRIITYLVVLFLFSILLISFFSYISEGKPPTFSDSLGVFTLTATILGTVLILISIDDWKYQDNRRLERETALQLSEVVDRQFVMFVNLFSYIHPQDARPEFSKYFHYDTYTQINLSTFNIIANVVSNIANGTHDQKLYSSRLERYSSSSNVISEYAKFYDISNELFILFKWIFDFKADNLSLIKNTTEFDTYKSKYDQLHPKILELERRKLILEKSLDKLIIIK